MRVYIASFFDTRVRLRPIRDTLWSHGFEVVSSWLDEIAKPVGMTKEEFWKKLAMKDLAEVNAADLVILDTIDMNCRGGREVEFGFALGCFQSKLVYIVGPTRNVFHTLADRRFNTWDECLAYLEVMSESFPKEEDTDSQPMKVISNEKVKTKAKVKAKRPKE